MAKVKIPEGFRAIADSDLRISRTRVYFNSNIGEIMFVVEDQLSKPIKAGPFKANHINSICHALQDVLEQRGTGRVNYLE